MPSPAINCRRRSSSDPDLAMITGTPKLETSFVPRSSRSSASSTSNRSTKFSYWTSWSNVTKLVDYVNPSGRRRSHESSVHSDLTEESLDAHNKLHGMISQKAHINNFIIGNGTTVDDKNKCSPYYKGLIDLTLSINREKYRLDSPERESHTTAAFSSSSSSSFSSFFVRMHEFGSSCFTSRRLKDNFPAAAPPPPLEPVLLAVPSSSSSFTKLATDSPKAMKSEKIKEVTHIPPPDHISQYQLLDTMTKPLRERVSAEPSASTTLPTETSSTVVSNDEKKKEDNMGNPKFILADKYRPKGLKDFICNRSEATRLQALMKQGGCDHVILEGPPGVGKRTMIRAMLREAFGPDKVQARDECKTFDLKGESIGRIKVNVKESSKHVEVNLSDLRGYEKHVIVELMKESRQCKTSTSNNKLASSSNTDNGAIVLCEADRLSTDAQLYIKWLLERYKGGNKLFFCCCDVSKLQPMRSLCTLIQLLPPSKEEIVEVLEFISKQEGIYLPRELAEKIADSSKNNLRQAIRSFEACWHSSYPFKEDQLILTGWEEDIANIAKNIVEERSPKQLYIIRGKLQILIEHDVSSDFIFRSLVAEVKKHLHQNLHPQVDGLYDEYNRDDEGMIESEDEMGTKVVDPDRKNMRIFLRIEEFIARFMSWYNNQSRMANAGNTPLAADATVY